MVATDFRIAPLDYTIDKTNKLPLHVRGRLIIGAGLGGWALVGLIVYLNW